MYEWLPQLLGSCTEMLAQGRVCKNVTEYEGEFTGQREL